MVLTRLTNALGESIFCRPERDRRSARTPQLLVLTPVKRVPHALYQFNTVRIASEADAIGLLGEHPE